MVNRGIHSQSPRFFLCLRRGKLNLMEPTLMKPHPFQTEPSSRL